MANIAGQGVPTFSERGRPRSDLPVTSHDLQVSEPQAYRTPFDRATYPDNVQGLSISAQWPNSTSLVDYLYEDFSVVPSDTVLYNEADLTMLDSFLRASTSTQSFQAFSEPSQSLYASEYQAPVLGRHMPPATTFLVDQAAAPPNVPIPALAHRTRHPYQEHIPTSIPAQPSVNALNCSQPGCNKTFGRPAEFRRHLRTVHPRRDASDYRCLVSSCDYAYPRADKVRSHMAKVHGLRLEKASKAGKADAEEMDEE